MIQLSGINLLINQPEQDAQFTPKAQKIIGNIIDQNIHTTNANLAYQLKKLCSTYKELACQEELVNVRARDIEPNNLTYYLAPLTQAVKSSNNEKIKMLLQQMAHTGYAYNYFGRNTSALYGHINQYLKQHPMPTALLTDIDTSDVIQHYKKHYKNDNKLNQEQYVLDITSYNLAMLTNILNMQTASFHSLTQICELKQYANNCQKIGSIMANNGRDTLTQMVGYELLNIIYETNNKKIAHKNNMLEYTRFKEYTNCLIPSPKQLSDMTYLKTYATHLDKKAKEINALQAANEAFNEKITHSLSSQVAKPKSCNTINQLNQQVLRN